MKMLSEYAMCDDYSLTITLVLKSMPSLPNSIGLDDSHLDGLVLDGASLEKLVWLIDK